MIWPVAGGKGGTGKSTLTANLGLGLSLLGYKVVLVDGDLGGSNLHLFFGNPVPNRSLGDFISGRVPQLKDVVLPTQNQNLKLICGSSELIGMADLKYEVRKELYSQIQTVDADIILIDLGAGTANSTLDFLTFSDEGFIVTTPEPQANVDAYGFIKNLIYRKLQLHFLGNDAVGRLIGDFARGKGSQGTRVLDLLELLLEQDNGAGREACQLVKAIKLKVILNQVWRRRGGPGHLEQTRKLIAATKKFLCLDLEFVGYVRSDNHVRSANTEGRPVLVERPKANASKDIYRLILEGLKLPNRSGHKVDIGERELTQMAKAEAKSW